MTSDCSRRCGLAVSLDAPGAIAPLSKDAELALFRALQEALANVAQHADAESVAVTLAEDGRLLTLSVQDDGRGLPDGITPAAIERPGHMGITGMRERIGALGGTVMVDAPAGSGVRLTVTVPVGAAGTGTTNRGSL
jgi:signal transduction histidine kinase